MKDFTRVEKLRIWMKRNDFTQEFISLKLDITRQTLILRMKDDSFKAEEMNTLATLGFDE